MVPQPAALFLLLGIIHALLSECLTAGALS